MANQYELPCIDVNLYCGINYNDRDPNSVSKYLMDTLHANDTGYKLIAECIYNWLQGGATRLDKVYLGSGKENTVKLLEALSLAFSTQYMFGTATDVSNTDLIQSISFLESGGSISAKRKFTLMPVIEPEYASGEHIVFESSDSLVASVTERGIVTAHQIGSCSIICRDTASGAYATYDLTVTPEIIVHISKFELVSSSDECLLNNFLDINVSVIPSNTSETEFE